MVRPLLSNTVQGDGIDLWLTRNSVNFGHKYTKLASNFTFFTFIKPCVCVCVCVCKLLSHVQLCDSMDCSLPGSCVLGILQARVLEWVAIPFSRGSS